ncbi:flagellar basal body rod protein FlgC [Gracilibacillus thailandensis]|jgi:flagellar basal-body rod protein FlgC|uniref:Flagellar basal-body rod protein FlgC n=1 Tax=Gracilibacillus thailandensis TaxID=563735 RepID=A0A6N7QWF5_9BACI|nr:flagellar basal body rod protein FlgC [Gracilibacillus thailandensis]MRI65472.1 flagellar basal body rod protein FlgC [Gracilibacillus thailandensis]
MSIFNAINTSGSGLTAQRLRMDTISSNIANADTTRATVNADGEYEPYRRKMTVFSPKDQSFSSILNRTTQRGETTGDGVKVSQIVEDEEPFKQVYNPNHPDANEDGYVEMPNVDPLKEMVDMMSATRSYEANVTSLNASKTMLMKALEIGK